MIDRFYGKTWIACVQFFILGGMGLFALVIGIGFWSGKFTDALDQPRPESGPPATIMGMILCVVAGMALCRWLYLRKPVIRLYKEGVQLMLVGGPGLGSPLSRIIGLLNLVWAIVSTRGFRSMAVRFPWDTISRIQVQGMPGYRWLVIDGLAMNSSGGTPQTRTVKILDAYFVHDLQLIAETIRTAKDDPANTERLPSWSDRQL